MQSRKKATITEERSAFRAYANAYTISRTRSYTITNEGDLKKALNHMKPDIETIILDMALYQSGLMIVKVESIHIMHNKYNPTRAGQYVELPKWIKSKRACNNIQNKDESVINIVLNVLIIKTMKRSTQNTFTITKKVESDLNFDGIHYPANNDDTEKNKTLMCPQMFSKLMKLKSK